MPATLEVTQEHNDLGYPEIDTIDLLPLKDFILCQWDLCQPKIKIGEHVLIRPDTHRKMHYTGIVIEVGDDVNPQIKTGDRVVFDQFSEFEKLWHPRYGRVALLQESKQSYLFMKVPKRVKVEGSELEYNFDK